jgi:hypothetical protein
LDLNSCTCTLTRRCALRSLTNVIHVAHKQKVRISGGCQAFLRPNSRVCTFQNVSQHCTCSGLTMCVSATYMCCLWKPRCYAFASPALATHFGLAKELLQRIDDPRRMRSKLLKRSLRVDDHTPLGHKCAMGLRL